MVPESLAGIGVITLVIIFVIVAIVSYKLGLYTNERVLNKLNTRCMRMAAEMERMEKQYFTKADLSEMERALEEDFRKWSQGEIGINELDDTVQEIDKCFIKGEN